MTKLLCTATVMRNAGKMMMPGRCQNAAVVGCFCKQHEPTAAANRENAARARREARDLERQRERYAQQAREAAAWEAKMKAAK